MLSQQNRLAKASLFCYPTGMNDETLQKYMGILKDILGHPPYLVFVFVTSVFMVVSMVTQHYYDQSLILFVYSVFGAVWRHVVKDIRGRHKDRRWDDEHKKFKDADSEKAHKRFNFWLTLFYQVINTSVVIALVIFILKVFTKSGN